MTTDYNAAAAAAARAAEARRRAEEQRRKAEEAAAAKRRAAEAAAAKKKAAEAAKKLKKREKPSTRFEALKKSPIRRESKSTRFEAVSVKKRDEKHEVTKAAKERYAQLSDDAGTKKAMEELGVQSARDFQRLGNDYAANLEGRGEPIDTQKVQDKKALARVLEATADTQRGETAELMAKPVVSTLVANGAKPVDAARQAPALEKAGVDADKVAELAQHVGSDKLVKTTEAIATLDDEDADPADKVAAALELGGEVGEILPDSVRERAIGKGLEKLPDAAAAIKSIDTLVSSDASAGEKAKAALDLGGQLKALGGDAKLARQLSKIDGPAQVASAALTLVNGDASLRDKAIAGAQLVAGIPDLANDAKKLAGLFKKAGVESAERVAEDAAPLAKLASRGLDLDAVKALPEEKLAQVTELAGKLDDAALKTLGPTLEGLDPKGVDAFMKVAGGMEPGTLDDVLASTDEAKRFTQTISKLDPKNLDAFAKAASEMDGGALKLITKLSAASPSSAVNDFVPVLSKVAGNDLVGKALGAFDKLVGVMKLDMTQDVAAKALKGLGKLLPGISAGVSGVDAVKFGVDAAKLQGKQDDLAFLAHTGMKLNALDAALEFIPGVGTLAGVGTGVAALALDLGFSSEKAKFEKDPSNYEAPDWVKAANVGVAMIGPPPGAGIPELVATYGVKDAAELGLWAVGKGGKLAEGAWELIKKVGGPAAEYALKAVDALKDLGAAGADALEYIAKAPGELGSAVAEAAVDGLEDLGEAGVEALKSIASSGADVAKKAAEGLKNLAEDGLDAAKDALGTLKDVPGAVGDFVSGLGDLLPHVDVPFI